MGERPPQSWSEIAARHPAGFFASREGQDLWRRQYARLKLPDRPAAWSLPPELGPWPAAVEGVVLRILSLLPEASAAMVGDFLWGTWRFRSELYGAPATRVLKQLHAQGLVEHRAGTLWEQWRAAVPVSPRLDPFRNCPSNVRGFIDRYRLAAFETKSAARFAADKARIDRHIRQLESAPAAQRDDRWHEELTGWRRLRAELEAPPAQGPTAEVFTRRQFPC
jgi:hypothetical protein